MVVYTRGGVPDDAIALDPKGGRPASLPFRMKPYCLLLRMLVYLNEALKVGLLTKLGLMSVRC